MNIAGNRWINIALNLLLILVTITIIHLLLIGGIELKIGATTLGIGGVKLTANRLSNPFLFLCILLLLKLVLARPAPISRLKSWLERNRQTILLSILIIIIASLPRLWNLSGHSLNSDEILWFNRGQKLIVQFQKHEFKKATAHLGHPGIVPAALIGASYTYLGRGASPSSYNLMNRIAAARLPIAILGIATCLLLYLIGRVSYGNAPSFWAAVLLAIYPEHISLSRTAHIDSTLTLFFMLSMLCYLIYTQRLRLSWKIASAIFLGLALLTKAPAFVLIPILFAWKAIVCIRDRRKRLRFWEISDLGWLGLSLAIYLSLFTKLWYEPQELHWVKFTSFLPRALPLINTVNRIASFPWMQIAVSVLIIYLVAISLRKKRGPIVGGLNKPFRLLLGLLLILLSLSFIQLFRKPIVNEILLATKVYRIDDMGHLKLWMGELVSCPPHWYYPYMLLIGTPPAILILLIFGIVRSCGAIYNFVKRWSAFLMALLAPLLFISVMSLGHKMAFRYIAPALPFVCLLASIGLNGIIDALAGLKILGSESTKRFALHALAAIIILTACLLPLHAIAPQYEIYYNFIIGGPLGATGHISTGWGTGTKEAVEYIKAHAREEDSVYAMGLSSEFHYYWKQEPPSPPYNILINRTRPPQVDWLVIPLGHRMKRREKHILRLAEGLPKTHTVNKCGVDFVDIYRLDDSPISLGQVYEAEDLRTDVGAVVNDDNAKKGKALKAESTGRRGMLVYGPYARYGDGCWRAVFRLRVAKSPTRPLQHTAARSGKVEGKPVAIISASGLSTSDMLSFVYLPLEEFESGGSYEEFPVDFCIDRPRRVQFCVEFIGPADLWVDRISVKRL